jgi:transcriptional regulator with XRE-family HTH domain
MDFQELHGRFVAHLRDLVRSGELTERGLARISGVSQPHIHNVLKGKRILSTEMSDAILHQLRMDLLDFVRPEDLARREGTGVVLGGRYHDHS